MKIARFSRIGFILAAAGSAVGLGNIWKFPYIAGEYGGGAFVFVYLITVLMIGFTIMIAEMLIGYLGRKDAAASFAALAPQGKRAWSWAGMMGIWAGLWIMTFYSVVIGWILHYIGVTLSGLPATVGEAEALFGTMLSEGIGTQLFYHTLAFVVIAAVLLRGIKAGIERLNLVLMPILFAIVGGMFLYALTLEGFGQAWAFMFAPNWHKLGSEAFVVAVGHAFFTISLGMGAILTYAASLPKKSNLVESSLSVVALDTLIALLAGLTLFTFLYEYGSAPAKGPGLVFISLPAVFFEMGGIGTLFALLFFIALAFAGLTSAVSLVEPMVQYLIDRYDYSRLRSVVLAAGFFYLVGIVALLSNTEAFGGILSFGGKNFFDWVDFITSSIMLPLGGLLMALFVGYVLPKSEVYAALHESMGRGFALWYGVLRYVVPVALLIVMLNLLGIVRF
ncbi:MAG: sodium-dependent transporter [Campylobacterales bacterium]|nr:sodium-dependent transporter [Campylobacterales bacterium]